MAKVRHPNTNTALNFNSGLQVLTEFISTIGAIGEDATIKILSRARQKVSPVTKNNEVQDVMFEYLCRVVYEETGIPVEKIKSGPNVKKDEMIYFTTGYLCRALSAYCGWDKKCIRDFLGKSRNSIYKYEKSLTDLHPKINKNLIEKLDRMEARMNKFYQDQRNIND